jgi:hypothetical protein
MTRFKELSAQGIVVKKTGYGNEHRVNYKRGREETAGYVDSPEEALALGREMAEPRHAMKEHEHPYWNNKK